MKRWAVLITACLLSLVATRTYTQTPPTRSASPLVERVGDHGFVQLQAPSFGQLTPREKALAYWLTQASIAIDPIIYDQLSQFGIRQKRVLEEIVAHSAGVAPDAAAKIRSYALLFWANRGNHNAYTAQKFLPTFTIDELRQAAATARRNGAFTSAYADLPALATADAVAQEIDALRAAFLDPGFEPTVTTKNPPPGKDIIQASANTFYQGVTLEDMKSIRERYPLNSRVVKGRDGSVREEVYRAGTPDGSVPAGLYAVYLKKAIGYLEKARGLADPPQAKVIGELITFYQTGEFSDWLAFGLDWVRNDAAVDFANGFIEVYRDARGAKGSSQSFVTITDKPVTDAAAKLAHNAAYFEDKAPWDARYKRRNFQPPVVKAVETLIETGDFHVSTIGDNLPNENEVHEKFGTKNFLLLGSAHALNAAAATKTLTEFIAAPDEIARSGRYGEEADDLLTAMHEVIGHGSGKLSERVKGGAERYLKEYYSTLEEARADLMAMWNVWDRKLKELGLVTEPEEVARAMYDAQARAALTQLRRIPRGDSIEEDHQRNRQLIVEYIIDKTGAIERYTQNGKAYIRVKDYQKMRQGVGQLLTELMRIKAEGDYTAIKTLVDKYGVHFDTSLRDQVVARFQSLDLPTYWAGVNPRLTAQFDANGGVTAVRLTYPRDPVDQYLRYASMYGVSDAGMGR